MSDKLLNVEPSAHGPFQAEDFAAVRGFWGRCKGSLLGRLILGGDPRWAIAAILGFYNILGFTVLGFNRSPAQMAVTTLLASGLEVLLCRWSSKRWIFPLSALITSFSLSLLLNFSHNYWVLAVPVFFAIGSKYVLTYRGRHFFNPALAGVTLSLLFVGDLITAAPAYQWNGIESLSIFMVLLALVFLLPRIDRHWLVISFLLTFTAQTALRAMIMRHHLPFATLFLGTLSSPSFILFTFFMITDPATSPKNRKDQIIVGISIALVDLAFHLFQSYYTFFYAGSTVAAIRFTWFHARDLWKSKGTSIWSGPDASIYRRKLTGAVLAGVLSFSSYSFAVGQPKLKQKLDFHFDRIDVSTSGLGASFGNLYDRVDPRVQHVIKWIFSVGDSAAAGDFDNDGKVDLFLTYVLKTDDRRAGIYRNRGDFRFERVEVPALRIFERPEDSGAPTNGMFIDYDNDGDLDLFVSVAFGTSRLFRNQLKETGAASFIDVTQVSGLEDYNNSITANFFDFNRDGLLDLFIGNVWPDDLPDYEKPTRLNIFRLPKAEAEGDDRMFNFMHASWHMAENGGVNLLYTQNPDHTFTLQDSSLLGIPETHWSLAIGSSDFNRDGWTDLYVANDFGPDDLYLNESGKRFRNVKGSIFGSIGRDTYKGMNASQADIDNNGFQDVYVSNVHHALQAEGSLLWTFSLDPKTNELRIEDRATSLGALNENRFGWGASTEDFDLDGWVDIIQANGMVDDSIDKRWETCPDYWYVNEKVARSPPSFHRYANRWGDIRGMCIYGKELDRVYLNQGAGLGNRFVDVAVPVGIDAVGNSRGVVSADFDNDGRRDVLITHMFQPASLYRNSYRGERAPPHWIGFELRGDGSNCNRQAVGSRVEVSYLKDGKTQIQIREAQSATGFSAQSEERLLFGLGEYSGTVDVRVLWCGKKEERFRLDADKYHQLEEKN